MTLIKAERQSNFELLRIVSVLMILMMHIVELPHLKGQMTFLNQQLYNIVNVTCNVGVDCFILISGWFGIRRRADRFADLILLSMVYAFLLTFYNSGWVFVPGEMCKSVFSAFRLSNWFLACYLLLYLVSPWLNVLIAQSEQKSLRRLILTLVVALGIIPTFFAAPDGAVIFMHGKCLAWVITVYILGRYLRLYHERPLRCRTISLLIILPWALLYAFRLVLNLAGHDSSYLIGDSSPFMLLPAVGLFYCFRRMTFSSRFVNRVSMSVFAVYLLNAVMFRLDADVFNVKESGVSVWMFPKAMAEALTIYVAATAIDKVYRFVLGWAHNGMVRLVVRGYRRCVTLLSRF